MADSCGSARSGVLTKSSPVIAAFPPHQTLYEVGSGMLIVPDDGGAREVREGSVDFTYSIAGTGTNTGITNTFEETHELVALGPMEVEYRDTRSTGVACCGHVEAGHIAGGPFFVALALLRRGRDASVRARWAPKVDH